MMYKIRQIIGIYSKIFNYAIKLTINVSLCVYHITMSINAVTGSTFVLKLQMLQSNIYSRFFQKFVTNIGECQG